MNSKSSYRRDFVKKAGARPYQGSFTFNTDRNGTIDSITEDTIRKILKPNHISLMQRLAGLGGSRRLIRWTILGDFEPISYRFMQIYKGNKVFSIRELCSNLSHGYSRYGFQCFRDKWLPLLKVKIDRKFVYVVGSKS